MLARTFLVVDGVRGGPGVNNIIVIIVDSCITRHNLRGGVRV